MIRFRKILTESAAVLSVLALLSSCGEEKPQSGSLPDSNFTGYYPDFLNPEYGDGYVVSDDITAKTDSEKYRVSDDTIVVTITSATPNLPIWCFRHPALEKKNGDKWELLPMSEKVFNDAFYDTGGERVYERVGVGGSVHDAGSEAEKIGYVSGMGTGRVSRCCFPRSQQCRIRRISDNRPIKPPPEYL